MAWEIKALPGRGEFEEIEELADKINELVQHINRLNRLMLCLLARPILSQDEVAAVLRGSSDASSEQTLHGPIRVRDESRSDPSAARDYSNQDDIDKINASLRKHGDAIKQLVEDVEDLQDCIEVITAKEEE